MKITKKGVIKTGKILLFIGSILVPEKKLLTGSMTAVKAYREWQRIQKIKSIL